MMCAVRNLWRVTHFNSWPLLSATQPQRKLFKTTQLPKSIVHFTLFPIVPFNKVFTLISTLLSWKISDPVRNLDGLKTIERSSSIMFDYSKPLYIFSLHLSSIQRLSARNRLVGCWPVMVGCLVAGSAQQKEGSVRLLPVTHYSATLTSPQTQKNHFYYIPQTRSPWMLENRCTGAHCVSGWQKLAAFPREQKWP